MTSYGDMQRRLRERQGRSLSELARVVHYSKGYLSNVERGNKRPTADLARVCDEALGARGDLVAAAHLDGTDSRDKSPWQTAELLRKVQASDTAPGTLDSLAATVSDLCCQYPYRDAVELRAEAHGWLDQLGKLLHKPVGLREHTELLAGAGWLALLVGCSEYDLGMRSAAEATRVAARQLGEEAGHAEIVGWTYEMSAWFALTQGRYGDVITAARAGQAADKGHGVHVQLIAQEAKAHARLGDLAALRETLDRGRAVLDRLPVPGRTDHHFVVDPLKWDFYEMDAYRLAGDDNLARERALTVITQHTAPDGIDRAPMRLAEAKLTLATAATRDGDLEQATELATDALTNNRRSIPSLIMVAGELDTELQRRYPNETATTDFREALRALG